MPYPLIDRGSIFGGCTIAAFWSIPMAGICAFWLWSLAHARNAPKWLLPLLLQGGGPSANQSFQLYGGAYSFGGLSENHQIPLPSYLVGRGSSLPGLVPPNDIVDSECMVVVKPDDSGVVIEYQVDEFTCTWSAKYFFTHLHIYPGFTGKV